MAVEVGGISDLGRKDFNLPEDACLFCFSFDLNSSIHRKNPRACLNAFQKAFPVNEVTERPVGLVIKCHKPKRANEQWDRLKEAAERDHRIFIVEETLSRPDLLALYKSCDCYLSLHRAEGFGRGMAEALLPGLEVIATGYSGNVDYCPVTRPPIWWITNWFRSKKTNTHTAKASAGQRRHEVMAPFEGKLSQAVCRSGRWQHSLLPTSIPKIYRKPVHLYPDWSAAQAAQSGDYPPCHDRDPVRLISWRRRHSSPGGRLRPMMPVFRRKEIAAPSPQFVGAIKNCHNNVPSKSTRETSNSLLTTREPILMATALPIQLPATKQAPMIRASGQ